MTQLSCEQATRYRAWNEYLCIWLEMRVTTILARHRVPISRNLPKLWSSFFFVFQLIITITTEWTLRTLSSCVWTSRGRWRLHACAKSFSKSRESFERRIQTNTRCAHIWAQSLDHAISYFVTSYITYLRMFAYNASIEFRMCLSNQIDFAHDLCDCFKCTAKRYDSNHDDIIRVNMNLKNSLRIKNMIT